MPIQYLMTLESFIETIDKTTKPGDDFYQYANGKWIETTTLPEDKPRFGSFTVLRDLVQDQVKEVLEDEYEDEEFRNLTILYQQAMDQEQLNSEDYLPLQPILSQIKSVDSLSKNAGISRLKGGGLQLY